MEIHPIMKHNERDLSGKVKHFTGSQYCSGTSVYLASVVSHYPLCFFSKKLCFFKYDLASLLYMLIVLRQPLWSLFAPSSVLFLCVCYNMFLSLLKFLVSLCLFQCCSLYVFVGVMSAPQSITTWGKANRLQARWSMMMMIGDWWLMMIIKKNKNTLSCSYYLRCQSKIM